jgi:hypothetical protein
VNTASNITPEGCIPHVQLVELTIWMHVTVGHWAVVQLKFPRMSALGQKQTYAAQQAMSALPPKADICSAPAHVRFGPIADILT